MTIECEYPDGTSDALIVDVSHKTNHLPALIKALQAGLDELDARNIGP